MASRKATEMAIVRQLLANRHWHDYQRTLLVASSQVDELSAIRYFVRTMQSGERYQSITDRDEQRRVGQRHLMQKAIWQGVQSGALIRHEVGGVDSICLAPSFKEAPLIGSRCEELKLSRITSHPDIQPREELDETVSVDYAAAMARGDVFPAPVVFFDESTETHWLADGYHRRRAREINGDESMLCIVVNGTFREAQLYATRANLDHGNKLGESDKRRAVMRLLKDAEWCERSNAWIGRACGVDDTFVLRLREEIKPQHSSPRSSANTEERGEECPNPAPPKKRKFKDSTGREREMNVGPIGKSKRTRGVKREPETPAEGTDPQPAHEDSDESEDDAPSLQESPRRPVTAGDPAAQLRRFHARKARELWSKLRKHLLALEGLQDGVAEIDDRLAKLAD